MVELERLNVVAECMKCDKIEGDYCKAYRQPAVLWQNIGACPLCSTRILEAKEAQKINPLKASKRGIAKQAD